jgi:hypothetical protein
MAIATAPARADVVFGAVVAAADVTRRYGAQESALDALRDVTVEPPRGQLATPASAIHGPYGYSDCPEVLKAAFSRVDNNEGITSLLCGSQRKG